MNDKRIKKIRQKFRRSMQKIVDESDGITGISLVVGGKKNIIAKKKAETEDKDNG